MSNELTNEDRSWLLDLADELERASRLGVDTDEPEGTRYVQISDALIEVIVSRLREIAKLSADG